PRFPLLSVLMDSSSIIDNFQAKMLLGDSQYQRINVELTETIHLDECAQIKHMEDLVSRYIQSSEWNDKKTWIQNNFLQ
ncbi:hypothetical protein, partial [Moorena sp. SIO3H5]|uniref:hypothetical protein n=1 Tax=Moorena sp. SIO3H5 TaxID=2607834 RepID=UPI0025CBDD9B